MSDQSWTLVHFDELSLSKGELAGVPEDAKALFALSSFAVSELNVIARVMLSSIHTSERDDAVNIAAYMQQSCILRIWTLKLFEFHECITRLAKGSDKASAEVKGVAASCIESFKNELELDSSYPLARAVRHEAAGHYSFSAAKKNLHHVEDKGMASLFVNKRAGNSFYPFGEEVMFVGRLNRHGKGAKKYDDTADLTGELFTWTKKANSWAQDCHLRIFQTLIAPKLHGKYKKRSVFWVSPKKVGEFSDFNVPLFSSRDLR